MLSNKKLRVVSVFVLVVVVIIGVLPLASCISDEAKEGVKQKAGEIASDVGAVAGEATSSWLGTTGANFWKSFDEVVVKRLEYLELAIDKVSYQTNSKNKIAAIDLTINNLAPASEKMYLNPLFDDNHHLVARDQNEYAYSVYPYADRDKYLENRMELDDIIKPGKSRLTVYTEIPAADTITSMLFIGKTITVP